MLNSIKIGRNDVEEPSINLFEGERLLVFTSLLGFILSAGIVIYIFFNGSLVLPEGNVGDAFSFNAALGIFLLSIAAILPFSELGTRKRKAIRTLFILGSLYSYAIETIQNFRGFDPRFSREGTVIDMIGGMLFGAVSLMLVTLAVILMIQFFKLKAPFRRPQLILAIRYALLSVLIANIAGIWMILLQDRMTGESGNLIVLHGLGFHALQTLIVPGWLLERTKLNERHKRMLIHFGSITWMVSIILISIQTALGRTVFELSALPILTGCLLLLWLGSAAVASVFFVRKE
jgi:hypothetical protein